MAMLIAPEPIAADRSRKVDWVVAIMLSAFIYCIGAGALELIELDLAILASYFFVLAMGIWTWIISRGLPAPMRIHSGMIILSIYLISLGLTTFLVQLSDIRIDEYILPQHALLLGLTVVPAFFTYRVSGRLPVARALLLSAHFVAGIGTLSVLLDVVGITNFESYGMRSFGFLSDPVAIMLTYPLAVYAACKRWLPLTIVGFSLVATVSRGPMLVAAAIIIQLVLTNRGRTLARSLVIAPILLVIMAFVASDRFNTLFERYGTIDEGRYLTPLEGFRIFAESPIFGYGYNSIGYFHPTVPGYSRQGIFSTASSPMVQMLSDGGLLLFLPYLALAIVLLVTVFRHVVWWHSTVKHAPLAGAAVWLTSIIWVNQFSTWFVIGSFVTPLLFGVLGAIFGAAQYSRRTVMHATGPTGIL